jgi:acylphosphatase
MAQCAHLYYSGRVQGVGFRYTVKDIANQSGVCGWVKNLSDGRVEVLAEAEEPVLKDFLDKVHKYFSRYIRGEEAQWEPAVNDFKDFNIKF